MDQFEENLMNPSTDSDYSFDFDGIINYFISTPINNELPIGPGDGGYGMLSSSNTLVDVNHQYVLNSYSYRSPEFEYVDFVFAGCSQTFGVGVPENKIWGVQLAKMLETKYVNISLPGISVQWIVQRLFSYFKEFGNPKIVTCLFPDFYRMIMPLNRQLITTDKGNAYKKIYNLHLSDRINLDERSLYSKKPHIVNDIIPVELPFYISCQYISMLEQYCKSNNIKLLWSTISATHNSVIEKYKDSHNVFSNYTSIDNNLWADGESEDILYIKDVNSSDLKEKVCHEDLKAEYPHCFSKGTDYEVSESHRHFGVHRHTHIAESFKKEIDYDNSWN